MQANFLPSRFPSHTQTLPDSIKCALVKHLSAYMPAAPKENVVAMWIEMRECENNDCSFRYPVLEQERPAVSCPRCGNATRLVSQRHLRQEVRPAVAEHAGPTVAALLDNIRSVFNVGSMFRIADGSSISHLYLGGITPTPDHPKMGKTALGAERTVPWSYHANGLQAAQRLQAANYQLWAIEENGPQINSLYTAAPAADRPIVLIVGNEVAGIDPDVLALCERVLSIPMQGQKRSLNVAVAFGIAAYTVRCGPDIFALFTDLAKRKPALEYLGTALEPGIQQGRVQAVRENILELLQLRFGTLPHQVVKQVNAFSSLDVLRQLLRQAYMAETLAGFMLNLPEVE